MKNSLSAKSAGRVGGSAGKQDSVVREPYYYEVWVSSPKYHKDSPLTYGFNEKLESGSLVIVELNRTRVPAVVFKEVRKPRFKTKPIIRSISNSMLPPQALKLFEWLKQYYPAPTGQIMSLFIPASLIQKSRETYKVEEPSKKAAGLPVPTKEQLMIINKLDNLNPGPVLIHGDTGTGKTRVYLELIKKTLQNGKSALLLTPEIGLTPQLAQVCKAAFPGQTLVVHSRLTPAEKRETWLNILQADKPLVVVGARSALFSPLKNIGSVIIDEFHESSYKQEQAPHYMASRVGAKLALLHAARFVLGSATPPISDYYAFKEKGLPILRMRQPALMLDKGDSNDNKLEIQIIDLKNRDKFNRSPWISDELIESIETARKNNEQSLIFLNRRGTARLILCSVCGWEALCPNCDLSLTYHGDSHTMICHTCGFKRKTPPACPDCGSNDIVFRSIGTKALVNELEKLFPKASVKRFDSDLAKPERLETLYTQVKEGVYEIIVGTQMLGKGLDLPKLSVLGVAMADTSLAFPDYTSEERTFQMINQVLGRVHRGHRAGKAIIQTYQPDNPVLRFALDKDYESFYRHQLEERKMFKFPPFCYILKLSCSYAKRASAENNSQKLAAELRKSQKNIEIIGPSPRFIEKVSGRYRWHIIVKSKNRPSLVEIIKNLPPNWSHDIDPINLL